MRNDRRPKGLGARCRADHPKDLDSDYWHALSLTNKTGLAQLRHYKLTLGRCAREHQEWLCVMTPFISALDRHSDDSEGLMTVGTHPPGQPLPAALQEEIAQLEEAVLATGTQVLEMRDSDDPRAGHFTVQGRLECAFWYLALGDAEGSAVRRRVWERDGTTWRHSRYLSELAAANGLTPAEYEEFRELMSDWLPAVDHPEVLSRMRDRRAAAWPNESDRFISYADMADLVAVQGEAS